MIIALTGHRPEDSEPEKTVRNKFMNTFLNTDDIEAVITGMAAGVDLWGGDEAMKAGIPIICARPWAGHSPRRGDEEIYTNLLANAITVVDVTESRTYPGPWVYPVRNHWMVDNATHLLAYWSGKESGGTYECVTYAKGKVPMRNIYG